jgi:hypothetical protein
VGNVIRLGQAGPETFCPGSNDSRTTNGSLRCGVEGRVVIESSGENHPMGVRSLPSKMETCTTGSPAPVAARESIALYPLPCLHHTVLRGLTALHCGRWELYLSKLVLADRESSDRPSFDSIQSDEPHAPTSALVTPNKWASERDLLPFAPSHSTLATCMYVPCSMSVSDDPVWIDAQHGISLPVSTVRTCPQ